MQPCELFQVLLRVVGVWLVYQAARALFGMFYFAVISGLSAGIAGEYLIAAVPQVLIGLYLLSGAGSL